MNILVPLKFVPVFLFVIDSLILEYIRHLNVISDDYNVNKESDKVNIVWHKTLTG